jgi:hypothetical protein
MADFEPCHRAVSQSVIKQVGAALIFTPRRCGRATLTPVLEYLVTEPCHRAQPWIARPDLSPAHETVEHQYSMTPDVCVAELTSWK